ncbi:MAG: glycosyltransferase family protein [Lachnospiraceae bacterium]
MDEKKICFISCINSKRYEQELMRYFKHLKIPDGYELEVLTVWEAASMTQGYNEAMRESNAKYKIYLHQDVFIVNCNLIQNILEIFQDKSIGMIGVVGTLKLPENAVMWNNERIGKYYAHSAYFAEKNIAGEVQGDWETVEAIDGLLMITQYDIPWREDLFKNWDFYDVSQSQEFHNREYKVVVPNMEEPWCIHDKGFVDMKNYYQNRRIFVEEYKNGRKAEQK